MIIAENLEFNQSFAQESKAKPKLIAVKFHADWCGSCKAMGPVFENLSNKLDGKPFLFYKLDLTNNTTKHQSVMMVSALGLGDVLKENPGNGFNAGDNGFEIPLYYMLMLFVLLINGAGKISLDHLIKKRIQS